MEHTATFQIDDSFRITGRGIVFTGFILDGEFTIGDLIKFDFNGQQIERKIKGIDAGMRVAEGKPNLGIMIESVDEKEIYELRNWNPERTIGRIYSNRKEANETDISLTSNKTYQRTLNGVIQFALSFFWIFHYGSLLYKYHFTDILFAFMYPNWTLILFIVMGIIGTLIGIYVLLGRMKTKKGYFQLFGLLIIGIIIDFLVV